MREYVVIVPVKPPARGKSRLSGLGDPHRRAAARAFALDTLAACAASSSVAHVLVMTDDVSLAGDPELRDYVTIPDGASGDLNAALVQAASEARRRWPGLIPVALCADLPALRSSDLTRALDSLVPGGPSFVADSEGVGSTLYTAPYDDFAPAFGAGSRAAHLSSGALEIAHAGASLRRDVDDRHDLDVAVSLGVGPRTAELVGRLGLK